ncbi:endonuclease G [Streptomyces sp. SAI-117]|uniref:trypsin-like serine peptidase n=1 Tax=unclassified Streptomyces TaxID=2593676 RepID=UPI0024760261|nr:MULTISPECIES: serine protease [unclassified Streptomyces]MDH6553886.1 endonuclease G [Streptomyces sp. SAI-041]MDH6572964.1 endonuclease G [Streptomyces sp. SAI-117]MDH6582074.1 endonuclease G [Streptomyces sp. SAI-133]
MAATDRTRDERRRQVAAAAARYGAAGDERRAVERQQDAGVAFPDSDEALAARATRLLERHAVPPAMVVEAVRAEPLAPTAAYERILGVSKELQAWSFLPRGSRAARTVARISIRENGRELPLGTGFLVSPSLLMTNHHVLTDADACRQCFVEFDAQVTVDNTPQAPTRLELAPDSFFAADERLDFALVFVAPGPDGRPPGETFGWNRLSIQTGKLVIGEPVNVIGHPMGRLKEIAVRDNMLQTRLDDFLHYRTDTEPGNSGSPVFNDQWEVVALHHSGVPRTDDQGRVLRQDGQVWRPGDGDDAIDWVANEGVRISSILKHLAALPRTSPQPSPLDDLGPEAGQPQAGTATAPVPAPAPASATVAVAAPPPAPERAAAHAGLRAREGAFGGDRHLVFLHGRSQEGKDPEKLRRDWTAGLNQGLVRAGLPPVDPKDVWFPYYGDRLAQALTAHEAVPHVVEAPTASAAEVVAPSAPSARAVYEEIVGEASLKWNMPQERQLATEGFGLGDVVGALQKKLSWLAARSDLDAWAIALIFRDVAAYLDDARPVREEVLDCVLEAVPDSGEVVLVSHSLGTVVALDLTTRLSPGVSAVHLTTAGSPLGLDSVYSRLLVGGPKRPYVVGDWSNVWCPNDPVAIGCPLADNWADGLSDLAVINARDRAHSIVEYLSHTEAARSIGSRLAR